MRRIIRKFLTWVVQEEYEKPPTPMTAEEKMRILESKLDAVTNHLGIWVHLEREKWVVTPHGVISGVGNKLSGMPTGINCGTPTN
jgi:hypothetical protein